jgi:hypothetical protein
MKTLKLILLALFIYNGASAQTALKGFELGKHYAGNRFMMTSVGGHHGLLTAFVGEKSHKIYAIQFTPSEDGVSPELMVPGAVADFIRSVEKRYGIELKKDEVSFLEATETLKGMKDGVAFYVFVQYYRDYAPHYSFQFLMIDEKTALNERDNQFKDAVEDF